MPCSLKTDNKSSVIHTIEYLTVHHRVLLLSITIKPLLYTSELRSLPRQSFLIRSFEDYCGIFMKIFLESSLWNVPGISTSFFTINSTGGAVPFTSWPLCVKPITSQFSIMSNHIITRLEETLRRHMVPPSIPIWPAQKSFCKVDFSTLFFHI